MNFEYTSAHMHALIYCELYIVKHYVAYWNFGVKNRIECNYIYRGVHTTATLFRLGLLSIAEELGVSSSLS